MQKRIILSIILSMSIILISLGLVSDYIINKDIESSLENRLALARLIGSYIDNIIQSNLTRLYDISVSGEVNLEDSDFEPEKRALRTAYTYSIFTDGIFLLNRRGNIILNYPARAPDITATISEVFQVNRVVSEGRHLVSNVYTHEPTKKKVIFALVPLKDKNGRIVGSAGGEIDPTNPMLSQMLKAIGTGKNTFIEIIDSNGVIIASTNPTRVLTWCDHDKFFNTMINTKQAIVRTCHQCHSVTVPSREESRSENILAFAPLETVPWGVSIQQPREEVFAPISKLRKALFGLGIIFICTAFVLTIGMRKSIIKPIQNLTYATERIAKGDMSIPVNFQSSDEIGTLSMSFETMRTRLAESLERLKNYSSELEARVLERTEQIKQAQHKVEILLKKVITSQEEERKRIARELHDEILQELSVFLLRLDMYRLHPEKISTDRINEMRKLMEKTIDDIHSIIRNLRPAILDDLGLESAIKWLLDAHLSGKGINCFLNIDRATHDRRFEAIIEITLFRIIQESIINIARHANAANVFVALKTDENSINVNIEDDGEGFDAHLILGQTAESRRGLGILGMKERAALLNGNMEIYSSPGCGTLITVKIPLSQEG